MCPYYGKITTTFDEYQPLPTFRRSIIDEFQTAANNRHPNLDPPRALAAYAHQFQVKGLFFTEDGNEYVWAHDVSAATSKESRRRSHKLRHINKRRYYFRKGTDTLKYANKPKPNRIAQLLAHSSEKGPKLPTSHPSHLVNFPPEILEQIMGYVLAHPMSKGKVFPMTVTSNCFGTFSEPHYQIQASHMYTETIGEISRIRTWKGVKKLYTERRIVKRPLIDATCLRSSKTLWKWGINILYSQPFCFDMTSKGDLRVQYSFGMVNSPTTSFDGKREYRPCPDLPLEQDEADEVSRVIRHIREQVELKQLSGWAYYDPFIRFLHAIGPENAARLKTLKFIGIVINHVCNVDNCREICPLDLARCLRLYVPIMMQLCTGVETIVLIATKDRFAGAGTQGYWDTLPPVSLEEGLRPFLETEVRTLDTLKELLVLEAVSMFSHEYLPFAEPTEDFFRERELERAKREGARNAEYWQEDTELLRGVRCDFCGRGHVWAACPNLCSFCGSPEHRRNTCFKAAFDCGDRRKALT